jgi:hypothetical protein
MSRTYNHGMPTIKMLPAVALAAAFAACQTMNAHHHAADKALPKPSLAAAQQPATAPAAKTADSSALIAAAGSGDIDEVKALLAQSPDLSAVDGNGRTALIAAAAAGHPATVKLLAKAGADVNFKTANGDTALSMAKKAGHAAVVKALLALGAEQAVTKN